MRVSQNNRPSVNSFNPNATNLPSSSSFYHGNSFPSNMTRTKSGNEMDFQATPMLLSPNISTADAESSLDAQSELEASFPDLANSSNMIPGATNHPLHSNRNPRLVLAHQAPYANSFTVPFDHPMSPSSYHDGHVHDASMTHHHNQHQLNHSSVNGLSEDGADLMDPSQSPNWFEGLDPHDVEMMDSFNDELDFQNSF